MKATALYAALAACLSIAPSALAQSNGGMMNYTPPTPQQAALSKQIYDLRHAADAALDAGQYAIAEADARKAISLGWEGALSEDTLATALYVQGKDQDALHEYEFMAKQGHTQTRELLPYALLLLKNGQYADAATVYNKALPSIDYGILLRANGEFSPDAPQPVALETACHIALGLTYSAEGVALGHARHDLALDQFAKALQLTPDSALANLYSGYSLKKLHQKAQADAAFTKAAALGNEDVRKAAKDALGLR